MKAKREKKMKIMNFCSVQWISFHNVYILDVFLLKEQGSEMLDNKAYTSVLDKSRCFLFTWMELFFFCFGFHLRRMTHTVEQTLFYCRDFKTPFSCLYSHLHLSVDYFELFFLMVKLNLWLRSCCYHYADV